MRNKEITENLGREFGRGLRETSRYAETRARMDTDFDGALDQTPPVGLNLRLLSEMTGIRHVADRIGKRPVTVAMLGLASIDGISDTEKFVQQSLNTTLDAFHVVDIDPDIIGEAQRMKQDTGRIRLFPHLIDARHTAFPDGSVDVVIRDHTGNCCPPEIDREIDRETARILKPGGTSIVNITTSDLLPESPGRSVVRFTNGRVRGTGIAEALRTRIYNLAQLVTEHGADKESLRGKLLEIEPDGFVIFGEDADGHGEWFRRLTDHVAHWAGLGFQLIDIRSRSGNDSHNPPLRCLRHNIVLTKGGDSHE